MTQQEQYRGQFDEATTSAPAPRSADHDQAATSRPGGDDAEPAIGTARTEHYEDPEDREAESYPASTYASGSADSDASDGTDRGDVKVVDRDEALAEERADDERESENERASTSEWASEDERNERASEDERNEWASEDERNERASEDVRLVEDDARQDDTLEDDAREDEPFAEDARTDREGDVDAAYDEAVRENEARDAETEDAREEVDTSRAEDAEDAAWRADHADGADASAAFGDRAMDTDEAVDRHQTGVVDVPAVTDVDVATHDDGVTQEGRDADGVAGVDVDAAPGVDESRPGDVDVAAVGAVWADGAVDGLRERWRALQLRFIDDPRAVASEADDLIGEALGMLTGALEAQRSELAAWRERPGDDTERLRGTVRAYRDFLDRLLGL